MFVNKKISRTGWGNWRANMICSGSTLFLIFVSLQGVLNSGCNWRLYKDGNIASVGMLVRSIIFWSSNMQYFEGADCWRNWRWGVAAEKAPVYHLFFPQPGNIPGIDEVPYILHTAATLHRNFQNSRTVDIGDTELAVWTVVLVLKY